MTTPTTTDNRPDLMAAVLEHLACYMQTGRPRSAHLASLLLGHMAHDPAVDAELGERCRLLVEVLESLETRDARVRPAPAPRLQARRAPWLIWECLGEAA
ncbi:MAG: hypothetical protein FJ209_01435 [Betaproteobacteria bacterium]|nr:hypothetical protein [Betaproteobacteria bacterium]